MEREEETIVIQINGKVRDRMTVPKDLNNEELKGLVLEEPKVLSHLANKDVVKVVVVPNKLVNLVVK